MTTMTTLSRAPGTGSVTDVYLADGSHVQPDPFTGFITVHEKHVPTLLQCDWVRVIAWGYNIPPQPPSLTMPPPTYGLAPPPTYNATTNMLSGTLTNLANPGGSVTGIAVAIFVDASTSALASTTSASDGTWSVSTSSVPSGNHTITITTAGVVAGAIGLSK